VRLICGHCGHINPSGASFCEQCDEYLDWTAVEARDEQVPATPGPLPPAQSAPPRQDAPTRDDSPVSTAVIAEPTRTCPRCATGNPLERRFCRRCGQWLVPASDVPAAPERPWRSWWQRLVGPLNRADRAAYRRSLSPVTRAFRAALLVLLVVVLVVVLAGVAGNPIGLLRDLVQSRLGSGKLTADTWSVAPLPGSRRTGPSAATVPNLEDGIRHTVWAVDWRRNGADAAEKAACAGLPTDPTTGFLVSMRTPRDVREIGFEAGGIGDLPAADSEPQAAGTQPQAGPSSWLPQVVMLRWTVVDGDAARQECQRETLDPTTTLQRFRVTAGTVSAVQVAVISASKPANAAGTAVMRIGEVTFWER
jgi:ribosomal protein L40E